MTNHPDPTVAEVVDPTEPIHLPAHARPVHPPRRRPRMRLVNAVAVWVVASVLGVLVGEAMRLQDIARPAQLDRAPADISTPGTLPPPSDPDGIDHRPPSTWAVDSITLPTRAADPYRAPTTTTPPPTARPTTTAEPPATTTSTTAPTTTTAPATTTVPDPTTTETTTPPEEP